MGTWSSGRVIKTPNTQTTTRCWLLLLMIEGNGELWLVMSNGKKHCPVGHLVCKQMQIHNSKCCLSWVGIALVLLHSQTWWLGLSGCTGILRKHTSYGYMEKSISERRPSRALSLCIHSLTRPGKSDTIFPKDSFAVSVKRLTSRQSLHSFIPLLFLFLLVWFCYWDVILGKQPWVSSADLVPESWSTTVQFVKVKCVHVKHWTTGRGLDQMTYSNPESMKLVISF